MAVPKRKTSKMKKRMRKAANRYKGIEVSRCTSCDEPLLPHRACEACGTYKGKEALVVD